MSRYSEKERDFIYMLLKSKAKIDISKTREMEKIADRVRNNTLTAADITKIRRMAKDVSVRAGWILEAGGTGEYEGPISGMLKEANDLIHKIDSESRW